MRRWRSRLAVAFAVLLVDTASGQDRDITGQVLSADGTPVHGATVELRWFRHPELPEPLGRSLPQRGVGTSVHDVDGEGRFTIAPAKRTKHALFARGPGGHVTQLAYPVLPGDSVVLTLGANAGLSCRVVDGEGRPVANADVEFRYGNVYMATVTPRSLFGMAPAAPMPALDARTDADGRFLLPPPANENQGIDGWIRARAPGMTTGWTRLPADATLELAPSPAPIRIRFQDQEGNPLQGVRVSGTQAPGHLAQSGADGTVQMDDLPLALIAFKPGYARHRVLEAPWRGQPHGVPKDGIELRRVETGKLQLLDAKGAPLPIRRVVFAQRITPSVDPVFHDLHEWWDTTDRDGIVAIQFDFKAALLSAFVEEDGRFVQVLCFDPNFAATEPSELPSSYRLETRPAPLVGRVVDSTGKPLHHARVLLTPDIPDHGPQSIIEPLPRVEYTDRNGRFRFDHVAKLRQRVFVDAGPGLGLNLPDIVPEYWTLKVPDGVAIRGQVVLPDGKPAVGAWVGAIPTSAQRPAPFVPSRLRLARADQHGRYTVRISRAAEEKGYQVACYSMDGVSLVMASAEGLLPDAVTEVTAPTVKLQKRR